MIFNFLKREVSAVSRDGREVTLSFAEVEDAASSMETAVLQTLRNACPYRSVSLHRERWHFDTGNVQVHLRLVLNPGLDGSNCQFFPVEEGKTLSDVADEILEAFRQEAKK